MSHIVGVVTEASVKIDAVALSRLCRSLAGKYGAEVRFWFPGGLHESREALRVAQDETDAIVVNPGELTIADMLGTIVGERSSTPIVAVHLSNVSRQLNEAWHSGSRWQIRGRGADGYRWAIQRAINELEWAYESFLYGEHEDQSCDLRLPARAETSPIPTCVVIHGGGWKPQWRRDLMDGLCVDLARRGIATWNIGYRRVVSGSSAWQELSRDVNSALQLLSETPHADELALGSLSVMGHSAGGQLACWLASQGGNLASPIGLSRIVSLAGALDMGEVASRGSFEMAAVNLLGGYPSENPLIYQDACPMELPPRADVAYYLFQGLVDYADLIDMNRRFASLVEESGGNIVLTELERATHFDVIDETSDAWAEVCRIVAW